ncbi:MAG: hypothetical protein AB1758_08195 [Candidatus Eremiobacterota bacterium]
MRALFLGGLLAGCLLVATDPVQADPVTRDWSTEKGYTIRHELTNNRLEKDKAEVRGRMRSERGVALRNKSRTLRNAKNDISNRLRRKTLRLNQGKLRAHSFPTNRGRLNVDSSRLRGSSTRVTNRLRNRGRYFRPGKPLRISPVGASAYVKLACSEFVKRHMVGALYIQKDPATGLTWRLQQAQAPVIKQVGPDQYAIRCTYYGQTSPTGASTPVVLEYAIAGRDKNFAVKEVRWVSVNGEARPGTFAIHDDELVVEESVAAEAFGQDGDEVDSIDAQDAPELAVEPDEEKTFPVKSSQQ